MSNQWIALALIVLVAVIIYSNVYRAPFVYDDVQQIEENIKIRDLSRCVSPEQLFSQRPVAELTFALNYRFGGLNVFGYHVVNVLIHILNGVLVYFLALVIFNRLSIPHGVIRDLASNQADVDRDISGTSRSQRSVDGSPQAISLMALLAALIFIAHPLQTQAVTYIIQRHASLATTFYFLAVYCYMRARILQLNGVLPEKGLTSVTQILLDPRLRVLGLYALFVICAVLAFLTKQNTATLPGSILLIEYLLFDRTWEGWKRKLAWFVPFILVMGIFILYVSGVLKGGIELGSLLEDVSAVMRAAKKDVSRWVYFCTQLNVVVIYIRLLFMPVGQNLDYMYPFKTGFFDDYTPAAFLFLVSVVVFGIWQIKRRPAISFGIFWFFVTLSIESSIFPIQDALFEHRLYLPMLGFAILLAYIVTCCFSVKRRWWMIISILIIAALGSATYFRNRTYESKLRMWSDVVSKSPQNVRAHYNLGNAFYKEGKSYEAIRCYSEALRIDDDYVLAHLNLGVVLMEVGRLEDAIAHLSEAMRLKPRDVRILINLGHALTRKGRLDDAVRHLSKAIQIAPNSSEAHNIFGITLAQQGKLKEAISHFSKAAASDTCSARIQNNLGQAFMLQEDLPKAAEHYGAAVGMDPRYVEAHYNLGIVLLRLGDVDGAIKHLSESLKLKPDLVEARMGLNEALRLKALNNPSHRE